MNLVFRFFPWLIGQIFIAGWTLAADAWTGSKKVDPCVVHYPLRVSRPWQLAVLSTSITVTPGTLSIGFHEGEAGTTLQVHAVHGSDPASVLADIADMEEHLDPAVADIAQDLNQAQVEYPAPQLVDQPEGDDA